MAHSVTHHAPIAPLSAVWSTISKWFWRIAETQSRAAELERLHAMSDRQLADIGVRRENIVDHVFRNMSFM